MNQREIKFRAWDKKASFMIYNVAVCPAESKFAQWPEYVISAEGTTVRANSKQFILMQYTGLKDKNGKEIFEGDIVKSGDDVGSIIFHSGSYWVQFSPGYTYTDIDLLADLIVEIIGNIHENPELFNKQED